MGDKMIIVTVRTGGTDTKIEDGTGKYIGRILVTIYIDHTKTGSELEEDCLDRLRDATSTRGGFKAIVRVAICMSNIGQILTLAGALQASGFVVDLNNEHDVLLQVLTFSSYKERVVLGHALTRALVVMNEHPHSDDVKSALAVEFLRDRLVHPE
ncbi:hypothetical protein HOI83_02875 [Candidatus Uhrbacteria bacterium]|jgi:hypothetical protein|nr:hypothetical protein [Candidatus Uhrbacteria bacterium]